MNERTKRRRNGRFWTTIILAGLIVFLSVAVGLTFYLGLLPSPWLRALPTEHSARYYPDDTLIYVWFTLNPTDGQREHMMDIWDRLEDYAAFRAWKNEMEDAIWRETGTDVESDLLSWLGAEISIGIIDFDIDSEDLDGAMTVDVRDQDAAKDFLIDWLDYWEEETGANFDRHSSGDFNVWIDEQNGDAFALSDSLLVAATGERILDRVLERVSGEREETLSADEYFTAARAALPTRRFTSAYVNAKRVFSIIEDSDTGKYLDSKIYDVIPKWIAGSAGWVERGMVFEVVAPHPEDGTAQYTGAPLTANAARLMPNNTVGLLAFSFDPNVQNWRDSLEEYDFSELGEEMGGIDEFGLSDDDFPFDPANLNLAHVLDLALLGFDVLTGIDLERDFFAYLEGELILGVHEFDYIAVSERPERHAVDAAALLSYSADGEQALENTLQELVDWLYSLDEFDFDTVDIGAENDAVLMELDGLAYSPGYVLHDGYLTVGTTDDVLERIIELQNGDGDSLSSDGEYRRAIGHLEQARDALIYINLHSIAQFADIKEFELTRSQQRLLRESLSSIAVVSSTDSSHSRIQIALTLFPETE